MPIPDQLCLIRVRQPGGRTCLASRPRARQLGQRHWASLIFEISCDQSPLAAEYRTPSIPPARTEEDPITEGLVRFIFTPDKADREALYEAANARIAGDVKAIMVDREEQPLTLRELVEEIRELIADTEIPTGKFYRGTWGLDRTLKIRKNWVAATSAWPTNTPLTDESGGERNVTAGTIIDTDTFTAVDPSWVEPVTLNSLGSLLVAAAKPRVEAELPEVVFWTYREEHLLPAKLEIDSFSANPETCIPLRIMFELYGIDAHDIADRVVAARSRTNGVRNLLDAIGKKATAHLKRVWKGYKHIAIDLRENGSTIDCSVQDRSNSFAFSRRSDGFKRFVSFLFHVSAPAQARSKERKLYLFDEPDLSLHPSGVQHLRDELLKNAEENTVVFSTHSIFMIDRERVDRHLIVTKNGEVTTATPAEGAAIANEEVIYKALDWSLFELLKPVNIVFEGFRDRRMFEVYVSALGKTNPTRKALAEVGLVHAQGVKDVPRVTEFLDLANRKYLAVTSAGGRMAVIEKWLKDGGIVDKEDFRTAASAIKQAVIDKLTPAHLEDEYATLITAVHDRVAKLTA